MNQIFTPMVVCPPDVLETVRRALKEDIGTGDATTLALVPPDCVIRAVILARNPSVVSGTAVADAVFHELDPDARVQVVVSDGGRVQSDQTILTIEGRAGAVLAGERLALNFMQRLTGIATLTAQFVEQVKPYSVRILDTRKTTPTLRRLEKYAVLCGGGCNHRTGLFDQVLVKDNHRRLWSETGTLADAVRVARREYPALDVEVEVETEAELEDVLTASPDWVLLDNMTPDRLRRCVEICAGRCQLEASGGITLQNVSAVAATGVNAISLGCLTHSAPAADLSLEITG